MQNSRWYILSRCSVYGNITGSGTKGTPYCISKDIHTLEHFFPCSLAGNNVLQKFTHINYPNICFALPQFSPESYCLWQLKQSESQSEISLLYFLERFAHSKSSRVPQKVQIIGFPLCL